LTEQGIYETQRHFWLGNVFKNDAWKDARRSGRLLEWTDRSSNRFRIISVNGI
jgi:hypothetical protein